jgi:hypothetical protein
MKPASSTEARPPPAPEVRVEPSPVRDGLVASTRPDSRPADATNTAAARRTPLARLLAALRGDKYMVDAYPQDVSRPEGG